MGWNSAVSLFQYLHRRMGLGEGPVGLSLPGAWEWRRDAVIPLDPFSDWRKWLQFYLDDFDAPEIISVFELASNVGQPSVLQVQMRGSYKSNNVKLSESKAVTGEARVTRMGAAIDGIDGRIGVEIAQIPQIVMLALFLLQREFRVLRWMQVCLGRLVRVFEFRRVLFSCFQFIWKQFGATNIWYKWTAQSETEMLLGLCLTPLAFTSFRANFDGTVLCSDASEIGGAFVNVQAFLFEENSGCLN